MMLLVLAGGFGCHKSIQTYQGQAKSLPEVAVLRTSEETCPITRIDGISVGEEYEAGNEYHLLPGKHTIQIVSTIGDCDTYCRIEFADVKNDFRAGWVYAILPTDLPTEPVELAEESQGQAWAPRLAGQDRMLGFGGDFGNNSQPKESEKTPLRVVDQGDVVSFAAEHPDYFKDSPLWKKLRKENGLHPSLLEGIKLQLVAWGFLKSNPTEVQEPTAIPQPTTEPQPTLVAETKPVESF